MIKRAREPSTRADMGYTHYWSFVAPTRATAARAIAKYDDALRDCMQILSETRDELNLAIDDGPSFVAVNGSGQEGCEPFVLAKRIEGNMPTFFCKTRAMPYDIVVTACLIVLSHHLKDLIEVSSDGGADEWTAGLELAQDVLKSDRLALPAQVALG